MSLESTSTMNDILRDRAELTPDRLILRFLVDGEVDGPTETRTFAQLDSRARAIARTLQDEGLGGHPVLLLHPVGLDYVDAFYGCLYAGAIAVPAYPPDPGRMERTFTRLLAIINDCNARAILTTATFKEMAVTMLAHDATVQNLRWIATDQPDLANGHDWQPPPIDENHLAFLQYTSGSTGSPKGVMVSHRNLTKNSEDIRQAMKHDEQKSMVIWLPPYHDMGLIGGILQPVYAGMTTTLMSPMAFLQKPLRWLEAISRFRATTSGGPNFAFDMCVRKVLPAQLAQLDLSSWLVAFNGAEPVRPDTLERFAAHFAPCGFRPSSLQPCYGLAECTLLGAYGRHQDTPVRLCLDENALEKNIVQPTSIGKTLVSSGFPLRPDEIVIVDPETSLRCSPGHVGEIWLRGPGVAQGYWNRPDVTREIFAAKLADTGEGPFLRTGDMGFLQNGELYVTGRQKDVIIIRGRNIWPQDVEHTVGEAHQAVRPGAIAAFSVDQDGNEGLWVVAEVRRGNHSLPDIEAAIRQAITNEHGVAPTEVVLVGEQQIFKTSSGKIQRAVCRHGLLDGSLQTLHRGRVMVGKNQATLVAPEIHSEPAPGASFGLEMSVFFFSADAEAADDMYGLFVDGVRAADRFNFAAVWIPERHFHPFGGLYPNPAVLASAAAMVTKRLRIRAGSVVLPLHDPLRVAEEWAVVDRLSGGRVDLAFAVGWNPNDFVLAPQSFASREQATFDGIDTIRRLWCGESIERENGVGARVSTRIFPRPLQQTIASWLTCSGGVKRFEDAGRRGFHVLTALLFQTPEQLAEKIKHYRDARSAAGLDPKTGKVTLMLHTFVGAHEADVKRHVQGPLETYLATSVDLWRQEGKSLENLTEIERRAVLDYAVERYCRQSSLIGTPRACAEMMARVKRAGVDEVACLIDFGVDRRLVIEGLETLAHLDMNLVSAPLPVTTHSEKHSDMLNAEHADIERVVREEVASVLNAIPAKIGGDTLFTALGIDSVGAVEVCERIGTRFGRTLRATLLFDHPTILQLTAFLGTLNVATPAGSTPNRDAISLIEDAMLPTDIYGAGKPSAFTASPRHVLLTGASGFLGAFLLHCLLNRTDANVYCLIRSSTSAEALSRLAGNLREYGLWQDSFAHRIVPLLGDLAQPDLGLTTDELHALTEKIEAIYHNGAIVNFAYRYQTCRPANVGGTIEVLRLACRGRRLIPVHHVSTTAIFSAHYAGQVVSPTDIPEDTSRLDMGYAMTKWVADKLAREAMRQGLPVTIYRPGIVTGSSESGVCHLTNFVWNLLRVSVEIGILPDYERKLDMTPVDWAAQAIVQCSLERESRGQTFHLVNPRPISIPDLGRFFASRGYHMNTASFETWQLRLFERATTTTALSALLPILGLAAADFYEQRQVHFESPRAQAPFMERRIPCPELDEKLLDRYVDYFVTKGFLPPAGESRTFTAPAPDKLLNARHIHRLVEEITDLPVAANGFWREPLEILLEDMRVSNQYTPQGIARATARLVNGLIRHARVEDLHARNPDITNIPIERPIVIVSAPRTGTTLLHNLLASDPQNRTLALWEMLAPVHPTGAGLNWKEHMVGLAQEYLDEVYTLSPTLRGMHPMTPQGPDECQWLMQYTFLTPVFTFLSYSPQYAKWLLDADARPAYAAYRRSIQALLWRNSGKRLVLKCPGHLWHLDALLDVFPDAIVVQIHRDMTQVLPSLCSLAHALQSVESTPPERGVLGRFYLDWLDSGVQRMMRVRRSHGRATFVDIRYADLIRGPIEAIRGIYATSGRSFNLEAEQRMVHWMTNNSRDKHGIHRYELSTFELKKDAVVERFAEYAAHVGIDE